MIKEMKDFSCEDKKEVEKALETYLYIYDGKLSILSDDISDIDSSMEYSFQPETKYTSSFNEKLMEEISKKIEILKKDKRKQEILQKISDNNVFSYSSFLLTFLTTLGFGFLYYFKEMDNMGSVYLCGLILSLCCWADCVLDTHLIDEIVHTISSNRIYKDDEEISLLKKAQGKVSEITSYHKKLRDKYGRNM